MHGSRETSNHRGSTSDSEVVSTEISLLIDVAARALCHKKPTSYFARYVNSPQRARFLYVFLLGECVREFRNGRHERYGTPTLRLDRVIQTRSASACRGVQPRGGYARGNIWHDR